MLSSSYTSRRQSATAFSHRRPSAVSSLRPSIYSHAAPAPNSRGRRDSRRLSMVQSPNGARRHQRHLDPTSPRRPITQSRHQLGLMLIAVSQVSYSTMNLFVKLLDDREGQGNSQPIGALEIVGVECLIIWVGLHACNVPGKDGAHLAGTTWRSNVAAGKRHVWLSSTLAPTFRCTPSRCPMRRLSPSSRRLRRASWLTSCCTSRSPCASGSPACSR